MALCLEAILQHEPGWCADHWPEAERRGKISGHAFAEPVFGLQEFRGSNDAATSCSVRGGTGLGSKSLTAGPALAGTAVAETPGTV